MRIAVLLAVPLALAACSPHHGKGQGNESAPQPPPKPTGPPPKTPTQNLGNETAPQEKWLEPQNDTAPRTSPYNNLLDRPVVGPGSGRK